MARNEEKALTLFNKWQNFKSSFHSTESNRRPLLSNDCESLPDAQRFRRDLIQNITKKISAIQNANLGEHKIRELNDEINKAFKQKHYWEIRIRELGGTVALGGKQYYDIEGKELPGAPGYRYYGAAKNLPGIRELFAESALEQASTHKKPKSKGDLYKNITPDYYGFRDDDDGQLMELEAQREEQLLDEYPDLEDVNDPEYDLLVSLETIHKMYQQENNQMEESDIPSDPTMENPHVTSSIENKDTYLNDMTQNVINQKYLELSKQHLLEDLEL